MPTCCYRSPVVTSKSWDHVRCLKRRNYLWMEGNIALVQQGHAIRRQICTALNHRNSNHNELHTTQQFVRLMLKGKVKAALQLLDTQGKSGALFK